MFLFHFVQLIFYCKLFLGYIGIGEKTGGVDVDQDGRLHCFRMPGGIKSGIESTEGMCNQHNITCIAQLSQAGFHTLDPIQYAMSAAIQVTFAETGTIIGDQGGFQCVGKIG